MRAIAIALCIGCSSSASEAPASDSGLVDSAVVDAMTDIGCAIDEEDLDGGCTKVTAAGARTLALEINPGPALDYAKALDAAVALGVKVIPATLPWGYLLEKTAPVAGVSQIDTTWFKALSDVAKPRNLALSVSIPLVDTVSVQAPVDLQSKLDSGVLSFDDAAVVARYQTVVDSLYATVDPAVKIRYLIVANEVNVYLGSKPDSYWQALRKFSEAIRAALKTKHPETTVAINVTFGGLSGAIATKVTTLLTSADALMVSYYLGANGFGAADGTDVKKDLEAMIAFAGAKPLLIKEFGYPTGTSGHSEAGQVQFVSDLFRTWDANATKIPFVIFSRMFDGKRADCETEATSYGAPGNEEFIQFLCTLGLRSFEDGPKAAWSRFSSAAKARGF